MKNEDKLLDLIDLSYICEYTNIESVKQVVAKEIVGYLLFDINYLEDVKEKDEQNLKILRNQAIKLGLLPKT